MGNCRPMEGKLRNDFDYLLNSKGVVEDKRWVFCLRCNQWFSYSGSISSLQYHLRVKYPVKSFSTTSTKNNAIFGVIMTKVKPSKQSKLTDFLQNEKIIANSQKLPIKLLGCF